MKTRFSLLTAVLTFLLLQGSSCGTPEQPLDPLGDFSSVAPETAVQNTGEARVRYILADMQLSGLVDYYRLFPEDAEAAEAVRRWDGGIRVVNIDQFERKMVGGTWQIVYYGTETPIDGMDVMLSEAAAGCPHPYFPLRVGAIWVYDLLDMMGNVEGTETWEVTGSSAAGGESMYDVHVSSPYGSGVVPYACATDRVYRVDSGETVLPAAEGFVPGGTWYLNSDTTLMFVGFETIRVPAGSYSTARFTVLPMGFVDDYWAEGIGMVQSCTERCKVLRDYAIPVP